MKLADFLFHTGMTTSELRRRLGIASRTTIARYLHGDRIPTPVILQKIIDLSGGRVQLRDFLSPGNPECATVIKLPCGRKKLVFPWATGQLELAAANDAESIRAKQHDAVGDIALKALGVLGPRARRGAGGIWTLDGRPCDFRRIVLEANQRLRERSSPLISYPGCEL